MQPPTVRLLSQSLVLATALSACGGDSGGSAGNAGTGSTGAGSAGFTSTSVGGASASAGGVTSAGGTTSAGGATSAPGGSSSTGGAITSGGANNAGGAITSGGATSTGGTASGTTSGTTAKGGATSSGGTTSGMTAKGGATSTGGTTSGTTAKGGATSSGGTTSTGTVVSNAIYVAPNGVASAAGTIDAPTTLATALTRVTAGQTIYLRGGTYVSGTTFALSKSGSASSPLNLRAYPLDASRPKFDFSSMAEAGANRGFEVSGSYWHIYGVDLFNAGDNCMFVSGSNNTIEFSTFSECADTGLQLSGGAASNLILNCDSYYNADSTLENADGFAAKLDVGTGNKFVGCRAWNNLDDGWDGYLRPADNITTTYENCWAIDNGKLKNGTVGAGDGNGFKTGGSDGKDLSHNATYTRCIAAGNVNDGFDHNSNRGSVTLLNSAAHNNGSNINFSTTNIAASLTVKNTISIGTLGSLSATKTDILNNSWQNGKSATAADFESVDLTQLKSARKSDGSLPDITYLKLVAGSDLRNAGTSVGLAFKGAAPDIGPFEYAE